MIPVKSDIFRELLLFCHAMGSGCLLLILYDVFRIIRNVFPHGGILLAAEDLAYWIFNALFLFYRMYRENSGEMRGYIIFGVVFGMLCYNHWISPVIVGGCSRVFLYIRKKCEILKNRLKKPIKQITIKAYNYFIKRAGKGDEEKDSQKAQ